jgi:cobyrinic acid a,c-diamide synthase
VARGFAGMRADVRLAGVVLNRVASPRHEALVRKGMEDAGITVFGALPRNAAIALPERHLGLVQAEEQSDLAAQLGALGAFIADHVDIAALAAAAGGATLAAPPLAVPPPAERIALARDAAFSFIYPHLLTAWRAAGATILPFSPLANEGPDPSAGACWLPGGYPELHGGRLAAAEHFRDSLTDFARTHPVHGECGGYMALGAALIDREGVSHRMAALLGLVTSFEKRKMHLGYRVARLSAPIPGHDPGATLRGHEFHYATILEQPDAPLAAVTDATGTSVRETGSFRAHTSGTFFHLIAEAS